MIALLWLASASLAGVSGYQACCSATGATRCPLAMIALGPGSEIHGSVSGFNVHGLWTLSCADGPIFEPSKSRPVSVGTDLGVVLTALPPQATACFDASCALPPDLCIRHEGDISRIYRCSNGLFADEEVWFAPASTDTSAVVLMGRIVRATRDLSATSADPPAVIGKRAPTPRDPAVAGFRVPAAPPDPCRTNFSVRDASNQQVDEGNAAIITADLSLALKKYRAAITINHCNAYAWAAMGELLVNLGAPEQAVPVLTVATRLMPRHHIAWANLGRASEDTGDLQSAESAYDRALEIQPGHAPAKEGLERARQ